MTSLQYEIPINIKTYTATLRNGNKHLSKSLKPKSKNVTSSTRGMMSSPQFIS